MATESPFERASWYRRSAEFGELRSDRGVLVMEYGPPEPGSEDEWRALRDAWLVLDRYPNMLDAVARTADGQLLVKYAAIDWHHEPLDLRSSPRARNIARWGAQLTGVLMRIWNDEYDITAARFLRPLVKIDVVGDLRVGFLPIGAQDPRLPPEAMKRRPRIDEASAMYVIGRTISELCTGLDSQAGSPVRTIVERCLQPKPSRRFKMLEELYAAWTRIPGANIVPERAWDSTELGIGWLELEKPELALSCFDDALRANRGSRIAAIGRLLACAQLDIDPDPEPPPLPSPPRPPRHVPTRAWADVIADGLRFEQERDFGAALSLYCDVKRDGENDVAIDLALARCHVGLGAAAHAVHYARRALAKAPHDAGALSICAQSCLLAKQYDDALRAADAWLASVPNEARGHYARGRSLFALGRLTAAREAFDRALALQPQLVEAMLLRREVDHALKRVRDEVGTPVPVEIEVPAHLAELRDALIGGRVDEVIPALEGAEYESDGAAKLVHAECLAFERRFEEAIAMYDRAATLSSQHERAALLGKARALLSLDRATESLAQLDRAHSQWPDDVELADVRASVLRRIGNEADADHELGRVIDASSSRSDARIGRARG